jgi:hypothetical protein
MNDITTESYLLHWPLIMYLMIHGALESSDILAPKRGPAVWKYWQELFRPYDYLKIKV